jgi:hypothetical protein
MNSVTTASGTGGLLGAYPSTASQAYYPQTEDLRPIKNKVLFKVETVENGYVLSTGYEGLYGRTYICATPQDLADRIITSMVTEKLEK